MDGLKRRTPWKPLDPKDRLWLIWSHHWKCWHRRSAEGGACGYTNDITQAGLFPLDKATEYHNPPPYRRDEAVSLKRVKRTLIKRLEEQEAAARERIRVRNVVTKITDAANTQTQDGEAVWARADTPDPLAHEHHLPAPKEEA